MNWQTCYNDQQTLARTEVKCLIFAVDLILICPSKEGLPQSLKII